MSRKTIKQIADSVSVSKQAVWQRVKRSAELSAMLSEHSETINGTVYIDEVLENLIVEQYPARFVDATSVNVDEAESKSRDNVDTIAVNVGETKCKSQDDIGAAAVNVDETRRKLRDDVDETTVNVDKLLIETLQQQLAVKDRQIERLETELSEERQHSRTLSDRLIVLTDQAQQLQALQLTTKKQGSEEDDHVQSTGYTPAQGSEAETADLVSEEEALQQSEKKKNIFQKIVDIVDILKRK